MQADEIARLRQEAGKLQSAGEFGGAEDCYKTILSADFNNIYALMGLGNVARAKGDLSGAESRYKAAAEAHPRSGWPWFTLVGLYADQKNWDAGEAAAAKVTATSTLQTDIFYTWLALGRLRRARGAISEALQAFQNGFAANPDNDGIAIEIGRCLTTLDRNDEAEALYRDCLARMPADRHSAFARALAALARKKGDPSAVLIWLERAVELEPVDLSLKAELAGEIISQARATGNAAALRAAAEKAHNLAPAHIPALIELAAVYRDSGVAELQDRAAQLYANALALAPDDLSARLGLGMLARRRGHHDAALDYFVQAQAVHPGNSWVRIEIGRSQRDLSRFDEAEQTLQSIASKDLHYGHALTARADVAKARGDRKTALRLLIDAVDHSPDPIVAALGAANEAIHLRDYLSAEDLARRIEARDARTFQAPLLRGRIFRAQVDRSQAVQAFKRASELAPDKAAPLMELAIECLAMGQAVDADRHLAAALILEPDNLQALRLRGERLRTARDDAGAAEYFARARAAHPNQPWPYLDGAQILAGAGDIAAACVMLAEGRRTCGLSAAFFACEAGLLREAGFLDRAKSLLEEGHRLFPDDLWLWGSRVDLAIVLGDFDAANQLIEASTASTATERARVLVARARLQEAQWRLEAARGFLQQAAQLDPANPTAASELAKLALFRFDLDDARRNLTRHVQLLGTQLRTSNITQSQLGQIFDEFMIDAELAQRLAQLVRLPSPAIVAPLSAIVAENPHSTAAAMGLMIMLRRTRALDRRAEAGDGSVNAAIPRTISQFWDSGTPPADVRSMIDGWISQHSGWQHTLYDDRSAAEYLSEHSATEVLQAFKRSRVRAQRADIFRLARLFAEGGVYVDADDRCRSSLELLIPPLKSFIAFQEDYGSVANNFLAVTPRHPVIGRALAQAAEAINRGDLDIVWLSTGPGLLTRAFAQEVAERRDDLAAFLAGVRILDRHEVRASLVPYCHAGYKRTARHWQNAAFAAKPATATTVQAAGLN